MRLRNIILYIFNIKDYKRLLGIEACYAKWVKILKYKLPSIIHQQKLINKNVWVVNTRG